MKRIILASGSPRRRDFIKSLGLDFEIIVPNIDESPLVGEKPKDLVLRLSSLKAKEINKTNHDAVIIAADTIVVLNGEILGKPLNRKDAFNMLKKLSGKTHQVITGYAIAQGTQIYQGCEITDVTFSTLDDELIENYIKTGESDDKSGSYAVQGIASMFIEKVNGSVSSVVGLPICQVRQILSKFGIFPPIVRT